MSDISILTGLTPIQNATYGVHVNYCIFIAILNLQGIPFIAISLSPVGTSSNGTGIMFLNEVALGEEHHIIRGDGSLTTAPSGYHSIVAKGQTEPGVLFCTNEDISYSCFLYRS